jgi:hypothetical protein
MQAWTNVIVQDKESAFYGRAGVVQADLGNETSTVKLDASTTQAELIGDFHDSQLRML